MWPRVVEFMLGCWLLCSPFIFQGENRGYHVDSLIDFGLGAAVMTLALLAHWGPTRYAHVGTLILSIAMFLVPRLTLSPEIPPAAQNFMMVGLLLAMFALVPNEASRPPRAWRKINDQMAAGQPTPRG